MIKWNTQLKISEEAARITRYSQDAVDQRGEDPRKVFDAMYEWLESCDYIVGHNILGFDLYLIKEYYKTYDLPYQHLVSKVIDTNSLAKGLKLNKKYTPDLNFTEYQYSLSNKRAKGVRTNLQALGREFRIEHDYDKLHNALVDLELNIKVWDKLKIELDI